MELRELSRGFRRLRRLLPASPIAGPFLLFDHAGIRCYEPSHSRLLAWLLDPAQSHGLGPTFLREFWIRCFGKCPPQLSPAEVTCEERNEDGDCKPDIIVRGPSWCIVIEVKIDSFEHDQQTQKYAAAWPGSRFAYLTRAGEQPSCGAFARVKWRQVREILDDCPAVGNAEFVLRQFADHIVRDLEEAT